jgi:hypothetical protein
MDNRAIHVIKNVVHNNGVVSHKRARTIKQFAEKIGFVYFGHVDHDDDHHIIRGLTASSSHSDNHYSVGSFDGYDVSIVDRQDIIESPGHPTRTHNWLILEIDIHATDIPHVFLGAHTHTDSAYAKLFTAFPALQHVPLGTFENYSNEFTKRYSLFAVPSQFIETENYFTAEVTRMIAAHFWPLAIELYDGALYIYADNHVVSPMLLETMLKNGLWLAKQLDGKAGFNDE